MGAAALARELDVEVLEACRLAESFFRSFPGVVQWQQVGAERRVFLATSPSCT